MQLAHIAPYVSMEILWSHPAPLGMEHTSSKKNHAHFLHPFLQQCSESQAL